VVPDSLDVGVAHDHGEPGGLDRFQRRPLARVGQIDYDAEPVAERYQLLSVAGEAVVLPRRLVIRSIRVTVTLVELLS